MEPLEISGFSRVCFCCLTTSTQRQNPKNQQTIPQTLHLVTLLRLLVRFLIMVGPGSPSGSFLGDKPFTYSSLGDKPFPDPPLGDKPFLYSPLGDMPFIHGRVIDPPGSPIDLIISDKPSI